MAHQKLDYICITTGLPAGPVEAGFVTKAEEWKYSSGLDYYGGRTFRNYKAGHFNDIMCFQGTDTQPHKKPCCISAPAAGQLAQASACAIIEY